MSTANWAGHEFLVFTHNADWNEVGGVYIFAGVSQNQWVALYIGKAASFRDRIPNHERYAEATRLGATHVHAMSVSQEAARAAIEAELILQFQPRLNTQGK